MQALFHSRRQLAPDVWEHVFTPFTPLDYLPGQYCDISLVVDGSPQTRTFTLISHPSESAIRFIARFEQPLSGYKQALLALQPDQPAQVAVPLGDAVLPRLSTTPLLFVAQGIALASYLSMLNDCVRSRRANPVSLLWARRAADDPLQNLIPAAYNFAARLDVPYPGRLTAADVLARYTPNALVYVSGSQRFTEHLAGQLQINGIDRKYLIYDYYDGYFDL